MDSNQDNIDHDLIDSLLDEFDQSPSVQKKPDRCRPSDSAHATSSPRAALSNDLASDDSLSAVFEKLLRSMPNDDVRKKPENLQESLAEAARMINSQSQECSSSKEQDEDELIRKLMEEFHIGTESNLEESVERLMSQMLSAETLQDPVKQVTATYPLWLAEHGSKLSELERTNYQNQYAVFKRMCTLFESGEAGSNDIMDMMTEIQSYGQPPKEIIQELAPGLEFNDEGEPVLKDLRPELANLTSGQPNCSLM